MHDAVARHRVDTTKMIAYFRHDLSKMRHVFTLSFYIISSLLVAGLLCAHRVSFFSSASPLLYQTHAAGILSQDLFKASSSFDDFFPWLEQAVTGALAVSQSNVSVKIMDLISIREIRVTHQDCRQAGRFLDGIDPLSQGVMLPRQCVGDPTGSMPPYFGVNDAFPLRTFTNVSGFSLVANFHDLGDPSEEYVEVVPTEDLITALAQIRGMKRLGWLDNYTACVCVDVVMYYYDNGLLVISSFIMERTTTGMFSNQQLSSTFTFFNNHKGLIAFDVIIFFFFLILFAFLCVDIHERYFLRVLKNNPSRLSRVKRVVFSVGPWEFITMALIGCILTATGLRFHMWVISNLIDTAGGIESYNFAVAAYNQYDNIYRIECIALVLVAFRVMYSFRYVAGLSKITNALRRTGADLARLGFIYIVLLIVFTISGCLLFGATIYGMRTFSNALAYLIIALLSASLDDGDYNGMRNSKGAVTDAYLLLLFLIFWMMMLNLVVAVISSAFLTGDDEGRDVDGVFLLGTKYVTFSNENDYAIDRLCLERDELVTMLPPSRKFAYCNVRMLPPYSRRIAILTSLRNWRLSCYFELARRAVASQNSISLDEALNLVKVHEGKLAQSHFNAKVLMHQIFQHDFHVNGALMSSVGEANDLQHKVMKRAVALSRSLDKIGEELHRLQNIARIAGAATGNPAAVLPPRAPSVVTTSRTPPVRITTPPVAGGSDDDDDFNEDRKQHRLASVAEGRRRKSLMSEASFTIREAGDVVELDSESSVDSDDSDMHLLDHSINSAPPLKREATLSISLPTNILTKHQGGEQQQSPKLGREKSVRFAGSLAAVAPVPTQDMTSQSVELSETSRTPFAVVAGAVPPPLSTTSLKDTAQIVTSADQKGSSSADEGTGSPLISGQSSVSGQRESRNISITAPTWNSEPTTFGRPSRLDHSLVGLLEVPFLEDSNSMLNSVNASTPERVLTPSFGGVHPYGPQHAWFAHALPGHAPRTDEHAFDTAMDDLFGDAAALPSATHDVVRPPTPDPAVLDLLDGGGSGGGRVDGWITNVIYRYVPRDETRLPDDDATLSALIDLL